MFLAKVGQVSGSDCAKRIFDISLSTAGLIAAAPLFVIIGIIIWLNDRGPIFYIQKRVGRMGNIFNNLKFRTMTCSAGSENQICQAEQNDSRVTRVGSALRATALDELPQLINILMGHMSFVGPRALVQSEKEVGQQYEKSIFEVEGYAERVKVVPGLTGVAQLFEARDIPREKKFKFDVWYINNRTFLLDLYLICASFIITIVGRWESRRIKSHAFGKRLRDRIIRDIGVQ